MDFSEKYVPTHHLLLLSTSYKSNKEDLQKANIDINLTQVGSFLLVQRKYNSTCSFNKSPECMVHLLRFNNSLVQLWRFEYVY